MARAAGRRFLRNVRDQPRQQEGIVLEEVAREKPQAEVADLLGDRARTSARSSVSRAFTAGVAIGQAATSMVRRRPACRKPIAGSRSARGRAKCGVSFDR